MLMFGFHFQVGYYLDDYTNSQSPISKETELRHMQVFKYTMQQTAAYFNPLFIYHENKMYALTPFATFKAWDILQVN